MNESISLELRNSRHDKVYSATLASVDGGFVVNFSYGARDGHQTTGAKTKAPTDLAGAKKIYDKLVREKTTQPCSCCGGTYQVVGNAAPVSVPTAQGAKKAVVSTPSRVFLPELLEAITIEEAGQYIVDPRWWAERKYDGVRFSIAYDKSCDELAGFKKLGNSSNVPDEYALQARSTARYHGLTSFQLDGESVGGKYILFDLLEMNGVDLRDRPREERYARLCQYFMGDFRVSAVAKTEAEKIALIESEQAIRGEGVVFKRRDLAYQAGRRGPNAKLKFWESATLRVCPKEKKRQNDGHASFGVEALKEGWVLVGHVSAKGPTQIPETGTYVEIRYLYVGAGGRLYQPEHLTNRDDVTDADCAWEKLKHKQANEDLAA
jgi:bifunctional non-homologous end joining protein LigD